ncbi:MAG: protein jag [Clostridiaceae bacterium]|nr:protein jag [Clostridiaceae bacterium]
MLRSVVKEAKSVDEAIKLALDELEIDREEAEIEVIEEGNKGIFGFIGNKNAVVKVTEKVNIVKITEDFLFPIMESMNIDAAIEIEENDDEIYITLDGDNIGILIGRRGETLDAMQYLLSLVINRNLGIYKRIILDAANYRQKREDILIRLANRMAEKATRMRRNLTLEPMNSYERRIIHSALQNHKYVDTYSVGEEPNRKVVIRYRYGN